MRRISSASRRLRLVDRDVSVHGVFAPSAAAHGRTPTLHHRHRPPVPRRSPPLLRDVAAAIPGPCFRSGPHEACAFTTLSPRNQCRRPIFSGTPILLYRHNNSSTSDGGGGGKSAPEVPGKTTPSNDSSFGASGKATNDNASASRERAEKATRDGAGAGATSTPGSSTEPAPGSPFRGGVTPMGSVIAGDSDSTKGRGGLGSTAGRLPHQVSEFYAEMERNLMSRMHAQDKSQFRAIGLSSLLLFVWVLSMFGTEIRRYFASQTAEVARETLKVQALQIQTQELATALVQALLNDQEVVGAGAMFLREASTNPETQAALVSLALFILQHPDTLDETIVLAKKLVQAILDDPESVQQVTSLALKVIADERFKQGATELVVELGQSEEVFAAVTKLASRVIQDPEVQTTLSEVLAASSHEVLEDQEVLDHSKEFVAQVIGDDAVQRSGGDALWNTVHYAFQTRAMRIAGLCLLAGSVVLLSGRVGVAGLGGGRGKD